MKKVLKISSIILFIMLFLIPTTVNANSFKLGVVADKQTLKPGETVELTLSISNIDAGELGINTLETTLEYDEAIFEEVKQIDITSLNNWSWTYNSDDTENKGKMLGAILNAGVKEDQNVGKIKLKVKDNISANSATIKLKDITTNNGEEFIKEEDKTITLTITKNEEEDKDDKNTNTVDQNTNGTDQNADKDNQNNNTVNQNVQASNKDNTISGGKIPQTGSAKYLIIGISIISLSAFSICVYVRIRRGK